MKKRFFAIAALLLAACGGGTSAPYHCFQPEAEKAYSELPENIRQEFEGLAGLPHAEPKRKNEVRDLMASGEITIDHEDMQVFKYGSTGVLVDYEYQELDIQNGQISGWFVKSAVITISGNSDLNCAVRGEGYEWQ